MCNLKELLKNETSGKWQLQQYRHRMNTPIKCSCCGKKHRKVVGIKEGGKIVGCICPVCLRMGGYNIAPSTMDLNEDYIAEQLSKKMRRVFLENPFLQSLQYREDLVKIVKKTCDIMKKDFQEALDKELKSFISYQEENA